MHFFDKKHGLITPLQNWQFWPSKKFEFFYSKIVSLNLEHPETLFLGSFCPKKKKQETFEFFDKNHGLTPLQNCQFWPSKKLLFFYSKIVSFLSRTS